MDWGVWTFVLLGSMYVLLQQAAAVCSHLISLIMTEVSEHSEKQGLA